MPMDMPPTQVVEYRIQDAGVGAPADFMSKAARFLGSERAGSSEATGPNPHRVQASSLLPKIDPGSRSLTEAERHALVKTMDAVSERRLATTGLVMPKGYVAERIRTAMQQSRLEEKVTHGYAYTQQEAKAYRCQVVATVMDKRAGAYVHGGEKAAAASRAALSKDDLEACKPSLSLQAAKAADARSISLMASATSAKSAIRSIGMDAGRNGKVGIEPVRSSLTQVDPEHSRMTRVDPAPSKRFRLDLKGPSPRGGEDHAAVGLAQAAMARSGGRGA
jgi:hypothetical protein